MSGQDADKRAAARNELGRLHSPETGRSRYFQTGGELRSTIMSSMITASRFRGARTRRTVFKLHSLKEVREFFAKGSLYFDLKVTSPPVHELDIAEARAA